MNCDELYSAVADHNNGYTYDGFPVVEDTDGDFTYANITNIDPLQTLGVHNLIDCPEIVKTDKEGKLTVIITLSDGSTYKYTIR